MSYSHAGEIGDIWKHFPLCEILARETPKRYFETNSAFAKYLLPRNSFKEYGVFYFLHKVPPSFVDKSKYVDILKKIDTEKSRVYFGSPAQAMMTLSNSADYFFHDIEELPLKDICNFSVSLGLQEKVTTVLGDSISSFLDGRYMLTCDDFVFIDPYQPFDRNSSGCSFFDIFVRAYMSKAKTVLWYGYDNLKSRNAIHNELCRISKTYSSGNIYTFDIWQDCMQEDYCAVNPGVPGCGLAVTHLSDGSVKKTEEMLCLIKRIYKNVLFNCTRTSILTDSSVV